MFNTDQKLAPLIKIIYGIAAISIIAGFLLSGATNSSLSFVLGIVVVIVGIMIVRNLPDTYQGRGWLITAIGLWMLCVPLKMLEGSEYKFNAVLSGVLLSILTYMVHKLKLGSKEERKVAQ
ncbi:MAG: hypothetical protein AB1420_07610 [Bacillota bacterium]